MEACLRLRSTLLAWLFAAPPAVPGLASSSDAVSITFTFTYEPPTQHNALDAFELQACA
jgi:hypothetical protein